MPGRQRKVRLPNPNGTVVPPGTRWDTLFRWDTHLGHPADVPVGSIAARRLVYLKGKVFYLVWKSVLNLVSANSCRLLRARLKRRSCRRSRCRMSGPGRPRGLTAPCAPRTARKGFCTCHKAYIKGDWNTNSFRDLFRDNACSLTCSVTCSVSLRPGGMTQEVFDARSI